MSELADRIREITRREANKMTGVCIAKRICCKCKQPKAIGGGKRNGQKFTCKDCA